MIGASEVEVDALRPDGRALALVRGDRWILES